MKYELSVLSDLSEIIKYNIPDYPVYANIGNLLYFYKYSVACHWHQDIEFSYLLNGDMDYFINNEIIHVKEGQGIFINSRRLHYNYSGTQQNCRYLVVTINPTIFGTWLHPVQEYMQDKFGTSAEDYIVLNGDEDWHKRIFELLIQINDELHAKSCNLLLATSYALAVSGEITGQIAAAISERENDVSWMIAWKMTGFIHKNYEDKITLSDIAAAGGVCRSKCCMLFGKYIKQTPNSYLMNYRVQKSLELLRGTSCSISEIAMRCGFQSASYYTQIFREQMGITPRKYRETSDPKQP